VNRPYANKLVEENKLSKGILDGSKVT